MNGSDPTLTLRVPGDEDDLESEWQASGVIVPDWLSGSVDVEFMFERGICGPWLGCFQDDAIVVAVRATETSDV